MNRLKAIDELRGLAVLIVMIVHIGAFSPFADFTPVRYVYPATEIAGAPTSSIAGSIDATSVYLREQTVTLAGWVIDTSAATGTGIANIAVHVDGMPVELRTRRAASQTAWERHGPQFKDSGWVGIWPVADVTPGPFTIEVTVTTDAGVTERLLRPIFFDRAAAWPFDARWMVISAELAVDLFFVISGMLITSILIESHRRPGALRSFYSRRAARILPLALIAIAASCVFFPASRELWPAYVFFVGNYLNVIHGLVMPGVGPMWSLAIEEQFYLLFPLLCVVTPRRHLWLLIGGLTLASFAAGIIGGRVVLDGVYTADPRTHLHLYVIGIGSWLAVLRAGLVPHPRLATSILGGTMAVAPYVFQRPAGAIDVPALVIIAGIVWMAANGRLAAKMPWLQFLGVRCYGLYLIHPFMVAATIAAAAYLQPFHRYAPLAFYLVATIGLATLSFRFFERPLMHLAPRRVNDDLTRSSSDSEIPATTSQPVTATAA